MVASRRILAAFDRGQVPTISVVNEAKTPPKVDFGSLVSALQLYVDEHLGPIWGVAATLVKATVIPADEWAIVLLDDADQAGALGYHDLTKSGMPLSKVFVRTTINAKDSVSVTASHELAEMLVDAATNICAQAPNGTMYAYEVCDAVEETTFKINGVDVSNFQYPAWFEGFRRPKSTQFDHLNLCTKPFQILKGGYMPVFKNGRWSEIFGSKAKGKRFALGSHLRCARRSGR